MPSDEAVVLDPVEFAPDDVELDLDKLGLRVKEAEWGDAEHELFLVRQELGEIPADRHPPNRTVTLKLKAEGSPSESLAKVLQRLQMKVGKIQERGGWVRRDPDSRGGFKTPVVAIVHTAVLGGIHGWLMAHRQAVPEITLVLTIGPYFYGTEELETAAFEETTDRELIYTVSEYKGTAPGLKRVIVTNKNESNDWHGVIAAWESRDYAGKATAALAYEAEDLTPQGGEIKELSGASGGKVVRGTLLSIWRTILSSEIAGVGHMTHVGPRRMFARVNDPAEELKAREKELRIEWRSLGSTRWTINRAQVVAFSQGYSIIDLGLCRPEKSVIGNQRWEWRIAGRTNGAAGTTIDIDKVWPVPAEQMLIMKDRPRITTPTSFINWDEFEQSEGNLNGKPLPDGTGNWTTETEGNPDFQVHNGAIRRTSNNDPSWGVWAKPPTNNQLVIAATMSWYWSRLPTTGVVESHLEWGDFAGMSSYVNPKEGLSYLAFFDNVFEWPWKGATVYTFTMLIVGGEYALGWIQEGNASKALPIGPPDFVTLDTKWETAQSMQIRDIYTGEDESVERRYLNFASWVPDLTAITYAQRGLEMRSDGVFRQHESDDVWGRVIADGFLPFAAPSLLESHPTRGIIIPTRSDLERLPDNGENDIEAVEKYYPGYHFASEAE